jgi:Sap, sulfolipid-1-addressing protein
LRRSSSAAPSPAREDAERVGEPGEVNGELCLAALDASVRVHRRVGVVCDGPPAIAALGLTSVRRARSQSAHRLLSRYAGLAFTLAFGALIVGATSGIHLHSGTDKTKGIADIIGGSAALGFGVALAGPATHVPGLFYLIALNVILAHNLATAGKLAALVTYNAVWFAVPLAALVICIARPAAAQAFVESVEQWTRDHARGILLVVSFGVGAALIIRGVLYRHSTHSRAFRGCGPGARRFESRRSPLLLAGEDRSRLRHEAPASGRAVQVICGVRREPSSSCSDRAQASRAWAWTARSRRRAHVRCSKEPCTALDGRSRSRHSVGRRPQSIATGPRTRAQLSRAAAPSATAQNWIEAPFTTAIAASACVVLWCLAPHGRRRVLSRARAGSGRRGPAATG